MDDISPVVGMGHNSRFLSMSAAQATVLNWFGRR